MYPQLLHIYGPLYINTYGTFIALAVIIFAYFAQRALAARKLMSEDMFVSLVWIGIVGGVCGGRLLYIISQPDQFSSPTEWFSVWHGGLSVLGAIITVLLQTAIVLRLHHIPMLPVFDCVAPYVALMHSIARIGCFFAGCCYGTITTVPWAITYRAIETSAPLCVPLHPTQLYSSLFLFCIFLLLRYVLQKKLLIPGQMACAYLMLMSIERFGMDFVRADTVYGTTWPLTVIAVHQLLALVILCAAACFYVYQTIRYTSHERI